jgi:hypothetical protein
LVDLNDFHRVLPQLHKSRRMRLPASKRSFFIHLPFAFCRNSPPLVLRCYEGDSWRAC